ncbi:hypothetical protein Tco_1441235, partial [Tanacetum coccineum]
MSHAFLRLFKLLLEVNVAHQMDLQKTLKNLESCMCLPFVSMYPPFASDKQLIIDVTVTNKDG